jgi:uncharacterized protein (DUF58 family)
MDRPGVRAFFVSMAALSLALLLALYSGAAAETGHLLLGASAALTALGVAAWVAITLVPILARSTPLRWFAYRIEYKLTRGGWVYIGGIFVVALAALNTGNNLLFLILSTLIASILMSGILSTLTLSGVDLAVELPERIFAGDPVFALFELRNEKQTLPSFSLRVESRPAGKTKRKQTANPAAILKHAVYFPYLPRHDRVCRRVELIFPRRGVYRQDAFQIVTRFPFGLLQKARRVELPLEAVVYPPVQPTEEYFEILPLISGELESYARGRGHDLYSLRDYQMPDDARFVHWKATARSGSLKVREFAREDERRVLLVFDPFFPAGFAGSSAPENAIAQVLAPETGQQFERAVNLCASLAWHFFETDALLQFLAPGAETPLAPAGEVIFDVLRSLACLQPLPASAGPSLLETLAGGPDLYKIIFTSHPRGSIPSTLWRSSYFIFLPSL